MMTYRYGLKASDIININETAGDMAVNLAIGETQIIRENREYLASHGVNIEVLESNHSSHKSSSRSTTTMLVKNLPPDLILEELESMFARHGIISSFLVPKSKTIAVVDYVEPSEARAAFKALAYRSYHKQPLYIEWAATDLLNRDVAAATNQSSTSKAKQQASSSSSSSIQAIAASNSAPIVADDLQDYSTLYVKNLSFETTEESLSRYLHQIGLQGVRTISIQMRPKTNLSMGYGFIEFISNQHAEIAMKKLQHLMLDGHALDVKASTKRLSKAPPPAASADSKQNRNTKLVVKNVPFQATQHEIRSLFASYGSVKSVRIPKKQAGVHRGFAFVDFLSHQEALQALQALSGTHFYGRHLVIDWTKEDGEDIDVLRKRAQHHANILQQSSKRMKLDDYDGIDSGKTQELGKGSNLIAISKQSHDDDDEDD
jgi:multiple RNA-binding domain-containing protein 1